jgi:hypothetical protein
MLPLPTILAAMGAGAILVVIIDAYWRPALEPLSYPDAVAQIQNRVSNGELVLYEAENLPICFYLGRTLPYYATREELTEALLRKPGLTIIWEQHHISEIPPPGNQTLRIHMRKRDIVLYEQK